MLTFNHVLNTFRRSNTSLLLRWNRGCQLKKPKNISDQLHRLMLSDVRNLSAFGKNITFVCGRSVQGITNQDDYVRTTPAKESVDMELWNLIYLPGLWYVVNCHT